VVARGLSDELKDRHYLIVDGVDGRTHYVDIGRGEATEPTPDGNIVRVTPKTIEPRRVDRTVAEVAAANDGRYTIDLHLKHDPRATEEYAETHVRRLEAIRRATGGVAREPDGTWIVEPDHLDRVVEYERSMARAAPVIVEKLSHLTLDRQVGTDGATWLDRELVVFRRASLTPLAGVSAFKNDPLLVTLIRLPTGHDGGWVGDEGRGHDCTDPARLSGAGQGDQGDRARVARVAEHGAQGSALG
jgi:hypothetical protein